MICIFCLCQKDKQNSIEHIIPESLGGGDWAILPSDIVCDSCNNYFGAKVESKVLQDYPLSLLRLHSGVRTKKRKWAALKHPIGVLTASPYNNVLGLDPSTEEIEHQLLSGTRTQMRIIAETVYPALMCRFLLKIALECVASDCLLDAMTVKYEHSRRFARSPRRGDNWWFMYRYDPSVDGGKSKQTKVEIFEIEGAEMCHIMIFGCDFFVPLDRRIVYQAPELKEPEYRYFNVQL